MMRQSLALAVILALMLVARVDATEIDQTYADVAYLSQIIGPRPVGGVNGSRAADWIEQRFWSLGYSVERQSFMFEQDGRSVSGTNLIANSGQGCEFIVGAHYDTVAVSPGANDNATGVAVMLAVADQVRAQIDSLNVCFIAFDGEDAALQGSRAYTTALSRGDRRILRGMLSLDMVGVGDILAVKDDDLPMAERIMAAAEQLGIVTGPFFRNWASDDKSFTRIGVSAGRVTWLDDPRKHSPEDRLEYVSPELLRKTSALVLAILVDAVR